jgi:hypothetical protein
MPACDFDEGCDDAGSNPMDWPLPAPIGSVTTPFEGDESLGQPSLNH